MKAAIALAATLLLSACQTASVSSDPADRFMAKLSSLCGKAFAGRVITNDAADADFAGKPLLMHVRECRADEIRIPFHVGDDRSRTWVVTRTASGLRLKHDHRHSDGTSDALTMYGGDSAPPGRDDRQTFPADAASIAMFTASGRAVSNSNIWAIDVGEQVFAYELRRPPGPGARFFRVEFDLTRPIDPPPAPWGA